MRCLFGIFVLLAALGMAGTSLTRAQNTPAEAEKSSPRRKSPPSRLSLTAARIAAATTFAEEHHPELADLLSRLKKHNRPEYRNAIRELYQTSEKLARTRERWPERYELDLEAWKLDSRIRLILAQMMVTDDDAALDQELEDLLLKRVEVQLRQLTLTRDRLADRVDRLDAEIAKIESDRRAAAKRALMRVKRSLKARENAKRKNNKANVSAETKKKSP